MKIRRDDKTVVLDLLIHPFETNNITNAYDCLLLFIPKEEHVGSAKVIEQSPESESLRIKELEDELRDTRDTLRNVVQEIETNSEELQATNEELLSANEELQSTNEELQSVNEELHTVNAELQQKIEDLASLNADMDNLLQSTDIGTIFLDREMRIRKFTPSTRDHFNLRDSDIDRPISHFASSFGTEVNTFERVQEVLDTGTTLQREIQSSDGNWFLKRITPYHNGNKTIDGAVISFVDINEIKKSEAIIRKSEQEFRALYDNAPDMFASFNPQGVLINCNHRLVENLGYENVDEVLGMHLSSFYVEEEVSLIKERFEKYKATGKMLNVTRELRKKDNSVIVVSVNAEMLYDKSGKELYSLCSLRDISDIREAQKKFEDKSMAFEQLLEGTMAGHWDWMIQEGTEYLSPTLKEMFGYEDYEIENTPEAWQKIIHPDDLPGVLEVFDKHVKTKGEFPYDNQVRYYHKDGSIIWVYCRGKVIQWGPNGEPIRMVGSHVDITPLKHIEEELYRSNKELEQFAYIASHDLQEPLNTITDFVKLFEQQYMGKLDNEADLYLQFIGQASNRMTNLVKDILEYSSIGKITEGVEIDCNSLLLDIQKDISKVINDTRTVFKVGNLPVIKGTTIEIRSLFLNLISNSIKFRKEDKSPEIEISAEESKQYWKFKFKDNGIGVAKKNKERVFNIFQRLNNMDSYEGTGIGLAQCKKIVELHHGEIWLDSALGKGSTFYFTIKKSSL